MFEKDHLNENGQKSPVGKDQREDRKIKHSNKETTDVDNAAHQNGRDSKQVLQEQQNSEIAMNTEKHYEKMCRSLIKRVHYVDRATSSADEYNWDYQKIQKIHNENRKRPRNWDWI